jgi:hypothetical protein
MFNLNPIEVLKQRKLSTLPLHFSKIKISDDGFFFIENNIESWIKNKLKGRYCIVYQPAIDGDGKFKSCLFAGFEDPKELTYFMLACPDIRR